MAATLRSYAAKSGGLGLQTYIKTILGCGNIVKKKDSNLVGRVDIRHCVRVLQGLPLGRSKGLCAVESFQAISPQPFQGIETLVWWI